MAAGLPVSFHSDYSVTPLGPLRMVQDAVTRIMADGGEVFFADERVAPELALRGVTIDAAYQCAVFVRYSPLAVVMIKATSLTFQAG